MFNRISNSLKEVVLPYIMLPLHAEDTLFYVFEADFRLTEFDCLMDTFKLPPWVQPQWGGDVADLESVRGTTFSRSQVHDQLPRFRSDERSEFLQHVTQFVTCCDRHGVGDLVWLGWNSCSDHSKLPNFKVKGRGKRRQMPHWGNQFISYTQKAAKYMLEHWEGTSLGEATFYDGALRRWLVNEGHADHVGASYPYPAFGGFKVHVSSNTPNNSPMCQWSNPDRQAGTYMRENTADVHRSIGLFRQKGHYEWVVNEVKIPDPDLKWKTYDHGGAYKSFEKHEEEARPLRKAPWRPPASRWSFKSSYPKPETKRQKRSLRKVNLQLGLRHFVDNVSEARFVWVRSAFGGFS